MPLDADPQTARCPSRTKSTISGAWDWCGEDAPCVVVVIDNYASFRERTGDKYEGDLITLSREGASYGIYLVIISLQMSPGADWNSL